MNNEALKVQATTKAENRKRSDRERDVGNSHLLDREEGKEELLKCHRRNNIRLKEHQHKKKNKRKVTTFNLV